MAGLMSLVLYAAVLTVSVTSVLLGLDWLASPPPAAVKHVQVARTTAPIIAPAPKPVAKVVAKTTVPQPVPAAAPAAAATPPAQTVAPAVTPPAPQPQTAPANVASTASPSTTAQGVGPETPPVAQEAIAAAPQPPAPRCDIQACSRAYVSFNAEDCTWQPYDGPRRFCDKGTPPAASIAGGDAVAQQAPETAPAQAQARAPSCNVPACARAYISFDASDCTWQPYEGPRQLCEK